MRRQDDGHGDKPSFRNELQHGSRYRESLFLFLSLFFSFFDHQTVINCLVVQWPTDAFPCGVDFTKGLSPYLCVKLRLLS